MRTRITFLFAAFVLAIGSIANAHLSLTINGLDVAEPLEIKGKEDLIIAVVGKSETKAQDISVTVDRGKIEPLTEPNAPAEKASGEYLFTFTKEADVSTISLSVDNEIVYELVLFYDPEADTVIVFGLDKQALAPPQPQQEISKSEVIEPNVPKIEPLSLKGIEQKDKKVLLNCPKNISGLTVPNFNRANLKSLSLGSKTANGVQLQSSTTPGEGQPMGSSGVVDVDSDITSNQIWAADNIYHVVADVNVQALLVIEPGTVVAFAADMGLFVNNGGTLISVGTPNNPVIYTSDSWDPWYADYYCPIYIEETASVSTKVTYSYIEYAYAGIVVLNKRLDTNIENNYFYNNVYGIVEQGTEHTDICNNLIFASYYSGIEVFLESATGQADANSYILMQNNTCDYYQDNGITVHGVPDSNDAGWVVLVNNIVSESYEYGLALVDGYMYASVLHTGYYDNYQNKNWEFDETDPVIETEFPYQEGTGALPICYLDQDCNFIDAGFNYIQQTPMIGKTTATTGVPDSNATDIGFHYCHWDYNNVGEGDYYPSDLNQDLIINFKDFAILANGWQTTYDINDLADLCENWLRQGGPAQNIIPSFDQDPNNLIGDVSVTVNVSDDEIARVYMFVDGEKYLQYGDIQENPTAYLETQYFRNGPHAIKIISQDSNNIVYCSEAVDVNFNNPVSSLVMDESFTPAEDFHIMALGNGNYDISVYDIVNETTSYSGTSTGQINITIPATSFPEEYGAYDFKMAPQGSPGNPLFNFLIRRKFSYEDLHGAGGAGAQAGGNWVMKMVVSIGDKKLEKAKEKCWRAALRAGVKKGFAPGIIVPADGDDWFEFLGLALTSDYCKIWYHVGHGNYKTIWPWNPERTFISSPSGKIFSYLKKDLDPVPPDYETVWGYEGCHSIAELGQVNTDKMIWVQINACYSARNQDFMKMIGTPNYDPFGLGKQVYIGWKNSALVYDILGNYNQFEYDYWKDLRYGAMLRDAVMDNLPPGGGLKILENFMFYGVVDWQYAWFRYPNIN